MAKDSHKKLMRRQVDHNEDSMRVMPWWWAAIATTTSIVLGVGAWLIIWLIARNDAALKVEAIKVGLSVTAGAGGAYALLLAFRRQMHSEYVARDTAFDAAQRRITELYAKAVEQLGHEKAAVRLGGLYALERLGHVNVENRSTVIDVICAYLRMPYSPPSKTNSNAASRSKSNQTAPPTNVHGQDDVQQELLVRMTAQNLLIRHLTDLQWSKAPHLYWEGVVIDLRGARLINAEFSGCRFHEVDFSDAVFNGDAWFDEVTFTDLRCCFDRARFDGNAVFLAAFEEGATFNEAHFHADASFRDSAVDNDAVFDGTWFHGNVIFQNVEFRNGAHFKQSHFCGSADFKKVYFKFANFEHAEFSAAEPNLADVTASLAKAHLNIWPSAWLAEGTDNREQYLRLVPAVSEDRIKSN
jgi:uncharacterized protein YjbI with pentapeptide repeats